MEPCNNLAYIVGIALGDGNLSCPNGRATRLRITCDTKYPTMIQEITNTLEALFPNNKVSHVVRNDNCIDISVYSNMLNACMPWKVGGGSKSDQHAHVPAWIMTKNEYMKSCVKGLIQTDGSIYNDREYTMVNFNNITKELVDDVFTIMTTLGYTPKKYQTIQKNGNLKHVVRLSTDVKKFITDVRLYKR